jgi:Mn-dependent DtxR family transcriptional regulator
MNSREREARATVLITLKDAGGQVQVDTLAAALGMRMRASVEDLGRDGLVFVTKEGNVALTPKGRQEANNLGQVSSK